MVVSIVVAEINNSIHGNGRHFVKWPPPTSKWLILSTDTHDTIFFSASIYPTKPRHNGMMYLAIRFLKSTPQKTYIVDNDGSTPLSFRVIVT